LQKDDDTGWLGVREVQEKGNISLAEKVKQAGSWLPGLAGLSPTFPLVPGYHLFPFLAQAFSLKLRIFRIQASPFPSATTLGFI
jgi:hypothetical protein